MIRRSGDSTLTFIKFAEYFLDGRTKNGTPVLEDETDIPFLWIRY
jgi:hypothetical protein